MQTKNVFSEMRKSVLPCIRSCYFSPILSAIKKCHRKHRKVLNLANETRLARAARSGAFKCAIKQGSFDKDAEVVKCVPLDSAVRENRRGPPLVGSDAFANQWRNSLPKMLNIDTCHVLVEIWLNNKCLLSVSIVSVEAAFSVSMRSKKSKDAIWTRSGIYATVQRNDR